MKAGTEALWNAYEVSRSNDSKRALVLQYLDLVRYVALRLGKPISMTGRTLDMEDMVQFGIFGLIMAIERFSRTAGVKFETYAIPRIRGAILDELRNLDWVPRSVRTNARRLDNASDKISQQAGRDAVDEELAEALAMSIQDLQKIVDETRMVRVGGPSARHQSEDGTYEASEEGPNPFEILSESESRRVLVDAIGSLPDRSRTIIALYYYEGLKFNEIARILKVSESRISQIHTEVLASLRKSLETTV
jgi:RNA polymerase sigma factor for flagellar operon FliA